jgi:hypothetical protein
MHLNMYNQQIVCWEARQVEECSVAPLRDKRVKTLFAQ